MKYLITLFILSVILSGCTATSNTILAPTPTSTATPPTATSNAVSQTDLPPLNTQDKYTELISTSPNKKILIYKTQSPSSIAERQERTYYLPDESYLWLVTNEKNSKEIITNGKNFFKELENVTWTDDENFTFSEGISTVQKYNIKNKKLTLLMGPQEAQGYCFDACGFSAAMIANQNYYVSIYEDDQKRTFNILNISKESVKNFTFKVNAYEGLDSSLLKIKGTKLYQKEKVIIDLETGESK